MLFLLGGLRRRLQSRFKEVACSPGDTGNDMTMVALRDSDPFFMPEALDPYLTSGSVVRDPSITQVLKKGRRPEGR